MVVDERDWPVCHIIVSWRLQPQYSQKAHYLPNQRKCSFLKFLFIKALGESKNFVMFSMAVQRLES